MRLVFPCISPGFLGKGTVHNHEADCPKTPIGGSLSPVSLVIRQTTFLVSVCLLGLEQIGLFIPRGCATTRTSTLSSLTCRNGHDMEAMQQLPWQLKGIIGQRGLSLGSVAGHFVHRSFTLELVRLPVRHADDTFRTSLDS